MDINLGNKGAGAETVTGGTFRFAWKPFWIYGAIWMAVMIVCHGVYYLGKQHYEQKEMMRYFMEQYQGGGDEFDPFDSTPMGRETSLERWIAKNLPKRGESERGDVADVFEEISEMLADGSLTGVTDAFPEAVSRLQAVATRKVWLTFMTGLTLRVKKERIRSADDLAETFGVIADAIRPRGRVRAVESLSSVVETALEPEPVQPESVPSEPSPVLEEIPPAPVIEEPQTKTTVKPATATASCPGGICPTQPGQPTQPVNYYGGRW